MSASYAYSRAEVEVAPPGPNALSLTDRLDAKLAELVAAGYRIQWIEIATPQMVTLFEEGGDEAIHLDPDPASDRAWYGAFEVRPTEKSCIWIWLEGEHDEPSAHVID